MTCPFKITPTAVDALKLVIKGVPAIKHPVLAPIFNRDNVATPRWSIGIYEKENLGQKRVAVVAGENFEFYIDPSILDLLATRTLDYIDGRFDIY